MPMPYTPHVQRWAVAAAARAAGVIQATDRDEFSYQEMIAHIPMCALEVGGRLGARP